MHVLRTFSSVFVLLALCAGCATQSQVPSELSSERNVLFTVPLPVDTASMTLSLTSSAGESNERPGLATAGMHPRADVKVLIRDLLIEYELKHVSQFPLRSLGTVAVVVEIAKDANVEDVIQQLMSDQRIQTVQSVKPYKLMTYNDPYFSLQNLVSGDRIDRIHQQFTGKNIVVGIVDTGVDRRHPELADAIVYTSNSVAHDQGSFDLDEHGTAVAGVIGSAANNDLGIVGVAPEADLMVFKACHQELGSRRTSCDSVSIVKALNDVLVQAPDILNLSLAGPQDDLIERLLRQIVARGTIVVAAVDESQSLSGSFPANLDDVIAVATAAEITAGESNLGSQVLLAPGTDLLTTAPGATYGFKSGSSMATAYVSGVIALMRQREPELSMSEVFLRLQNSTRLSESRLPFVDLCLAVNFSATGNTSMCQHSPRMAANTAPIEVADDALGSTRAVVMP